MQLVEFEGQTVEFPDDFTDDEIADALSTLEPAAPIGAPAKGGSLIEAELFDGTILEFPHGTAPEVIQRVAKEQGMVDMREDGFLKALDGQTTISEVNRVAAGEA